MSESSRFVVKDQSNPLFFFFFFFIIVDKNFGEGSPLQQGDTSLYI
jgi:hypothetical protein